MILSTKSFQIREEEDIISATFPLLPGAEGGGVRQGLIVLECNTGFALHLCRMKLEFRDIRGLFGIMSFLALEMRRVNECEGSVIE